MQFLHVRRTVDGLDSAQRVWFSRLNTYGTISSRSPLRNRIGIDLIVGIMVSLGQTSWQRGARNLAAGITLQKINGVIDCLEGLDLPRDHLLYAEERILQHKTGDITLVLIPPNEPYGNSTTETLTVDYNFGVFEVLAGANIVESSLRINGDALLPRVSSRQAVASVLEHQNITKQVVYQDFGNRQAMTDVACVSVEHEDGDIASVLLVRGLQQIRV